MKQLKELQQEHKLLTGMVNNRGDAKDPREAENLRKYGQRVKFLKGCILYLETNPKEATVLGWLRDAENRKEVIEKGFEPWLINDQGIPKEKMDKVSPERMGKLRATYNNLCEKTKINNQIKTLQFLLT